MMKRKIPILALAAAISLTAATAGAWCIGAPLGPDGLPVVAPVLDTDGDGLNSLQEAFLGTDPDNPDTDGDGVLDSFEVIDGVRNLDRPSLFSAERYADPNDPENRQIVVLEGTSLFRGNRQLGAAWVNVEDTGRRRLVRQSALRGNNQNRIALRLPNARARRFLGDLPSKMFVRTFGRRTTNRLELQPMDIECNSPKLMGAALIRLNAEIDGTIETFDYIGIGGCGLVEQLTLREVTTTVVLEDHGLPIDEYRFNLTGAGRGVPLIGSRILTPVRPLIVADNSNPLPDDTDEIRVGDRLTVVRGTEASAVDQIIFVEGLTADLTIPESDLAEDHDGDGIPSITEIREGTDPLVYDTDRDGLHDGVERRLPLDPNDPDTDDDGILDRDELPDMVPLQPLRVWNPRVRQSKRRAIRRR